MDLTGIGWSGMDWLNQAQDRDQWWAFICMAIDLWIP
jgi:hypothetical protein